MTAPKTPTLDYLKEVSSKGKLDLSEEELKAYQERIANHLKHYEDFDRLQVEVPEQRYPRGTGYRPQPDEDPHNAWWYKCAIKGAPQGKLQGKRVAIKDSILVAGIPLLNGCHLMNGFIPDEDATIVTRILDEGGDIVGKTNCENLCFSGSSDTCWVGKVLNPHDKTRTSGGSSSGSAVVVSLEEADMAIGGDQAGSIRLPACWCGIVGLKPTFGLVPYTGAMSMLGNLDHVGPMTRTVKDCALLLEVIAGRDGFDHRQPCDLKVPEYSKLLDGKISGMKLGTLTEGFANCEEDIITLVRSACEQFVRLGVTLEEVSIPEHNTIRSLQLVQILEGSYKTMLRDAGSTVGLKGHQNVACTEHLRRGLATRARDLSGNLKFLYLFGNFMEDNYGSQYYQKSVNLLPQFERAYNKAFEKYDALVMPTIPIKPYKFGEKHQDVFQNTAPFNLTGLPAITINVGKSEGLPVGIQIVGKCWDETKILQLAYALEQALLQTN